ncbi:hypothetical protein [Gracilibacillus saliphilus]|uniref:hypothetical protein n=1 Tax=Gracilibacillus saliphilus TaxID=543890 RepID=UPI0013D5DDD3|nr:hypothetical protein [Gracilibacillus saliphilus]
MKIYFLQKNKEETSQSLKNQAYLVSLLSPPFIFIINYFMDKSNIMNGEINIENFKDILEWIDKNKKFENESAKKQYIQALMLDKAE